MIEQELDAIVGMLPNNPTKVEALLAELIEAGKLDFDHIRFRMAGLFKRGYQWDVIQAEYPAPRPNELRKLHLELSREGLYDMLPYSLFHHSRQSDAFKSIDKLTEETRQIEEEAQNARRFFAPFEQEFVRTRIKLELLERNLVSGFFNPLQEAIFNQFWKSGSHNIPVEQLQVLFYLLPLAHKIAGNLELMRQCFAAVLLEVVGLEYVQADPDDFSELNTPALGAMELGVDAILGGVVAAEIPQLQITIGPVELKNIPAYLPGRSNDELLQFLCSYFVPLELDPCITVALKRTYVGVDTITPFALEKEDEATARLGYSTVI